MKHKALKLNHYYLLKFLDHTICEQKDIVTCVVAGRLISKTKTHYSLAYWFIEEEEYREGNLGIVNVLKTTIIAAVEIPQAFEKL